MPHRRSVFFVSDRTGITVEMLGNSLLTQFDTVEFKKHTLAFVDNVDKIHEAMRQIESARSESGKRPLVFTSLMKDELRKEIAGANALVLDLFDRFIVPLEGELGVKSAHAVGRSHSAGNIRDYNHRIEAVNYTLAHDDGVTNRNLDEADIILVGVSRSGKTPTCLYLALQFGGKAANYPGMVALSTADKRRAAKLGEKSEYFCRQTLRMLAENPQVIPPNLDLADAIADLDARDALRPRLMRLTRLLERGIDGDFALGRDDMAAATRGYSLLKSVSGREGLDQLKRDLGTRFAKTRRKTPDEKKAA